jgi:peptidoglycan/LPS O-acetylase OafA/YrhL
LRCLLGFSLGIGSYQLYRRVNSAPGAFAADWLMGTVLLAILALLHAHWRDYLVLPLFGLLIVCAALNAGRFGRILNTRPLRALGDLSYSIYLLQFFWLFVWNVWFDLHWHLAHPDGLPGYRERLFWLGLILASVISSAALSYRFIEIPCREFLRTLTPEETSP